MKGVLKILIIE